MRVGFILFLFGLSSLQAQEGHFWNLFDAYCQKNNEHSMYYEIDAFQSANSKDAVESTYGELYRKGDIYMLKMPEVLQVMNADWAIQLIEANKTVIVTKPLNTPDAIEGIDYSSMLRKLRKKDVLTYSETEKSFVLSTQISDNSEFRRIQWYFAKGEKFELDKTILYFNKVYLTNSTSEGGSGEEYSLDDPRLEIKFVERDIDPIRVRDIIKIDGDEIKLTSTYSQYKLLDMSERYEATKTNR